MNEQLYEQATVWTSDWMSERPNERVNDRERVADITSERERARATQLKTAERNGRGGVEACVAEFHLGIDDRY